MARRKKPQKVDKTEQNGETKLQLFDFFKKKESYGTPPVDNERRQAFLHAFEVTCGNITASCNIAGIDRSTYYRWMKGISDEDIEFQNRLEEIQPLERFLDIAELGLLALVMTGDARAITYFLDKKGKHRGYVDKKDTTERELTERAVNRTLKAINEHQAKHPDFQPNLRELAYLAAEDFGVSAEVVERELIERYNKQRKQI